MTEARWRASVVMLFMLVSATASLAQPAQTITVVSAAPLFVLPDEHREPLGIAKEGSVLNALKVEGDWYNVEFQDSQLGRRVGYVQRKYVKVSLPGPSRLQPIALSVPQTVPSPETAPQPRTIRPPLTSGSQQSIANVAELIVNGGLEEPAISSDFQTFLPAVSGITGWRVTGGDVDLTRNTFFPSFEGVQTVDLVGFTPGTLEQSFATLPSERYTLSFMYADNARAPRGFNYQALVQVFGQSELVHQTFAHSDSTVLNMKYAHFLGTFVANSTVTTLRFSALNASGNGGIVLDAVSVKGPQATTASQMPVDVTKVTRSLPNEPTSPVPAAPQVPPLATLARQGYRLTAAEAQQLEQRLTVNANDLPARSQLLGYWFSRGPQDVGAQAAIAARRRHILWIIENHADSEICGLSETTLDRDSRFSTLADQIGYEQARQLWVVKTSPQSATIATLANAAFFFKMPDKPLAAALYARLESLEPQNPQWKVLHGAVLAYAIAGVANLNQNGLPLAFDPLEAASAFAKSVRSDLETTGDANLLLSVSGVLTMQGAMEPRGRTEILSLAERYAVRARGLDPKNPAFAAQSDRQLAENYRLQALQTRDVGERDRLLRQRLALLEKGFAAPQLNDPQRASELVDLARARADAGEMEPAAELARALLRLASQMEVPQKPGGFVDEVRHQSHLILGRAALRAGNVAAASQELLAAGKVGGGGTLSSFGPNMMLAKELLEKGARDVVVEYLEECRTFWTFEQTKKPEQNKLNSWITTIRGGRIPEFGANLIY